MGIRKFLGTVGIKSIDDDKYAVSLAACIGGLMGGAGVWLGDLSLGLFGAL